MRHKKIAYTASFGMLWGLSEFFIGTGLHMLRIPFRGSILTFIGVWIILTGLKYIPGNAKGALIGMGVICAAVKLLTIGIIPRPNIYISIIVEAVLAEAGVMVGGRRPFGYMLAGSLAMLWPPFSRVMAAGLMLGGDYLILVERIGLGEHILLAALFVAVIHIISGATAGIAAWRFKND